MHKHIVAACMAVFLLFTAAHGQKAEITVSLNETFFEALLDSIYQNFDAPEFALKEEKTSGCSESIRIVKEMNGVRTAVRFREGRVNMPLAFTGKYSAPFVGCIDFAGWADTNIDLEFDRNDQRLIGRARVQSVNLNGTGGVGGALIAKMLQSTIDKKLNPIEILRIEKLSFSFPFQNSANIRMRATDIKPEISNGQLNIRVLYEFLKG